MSATAAQVPIDEVMAVRPGDTAAASAVDGWLLEFAASRDPVLRQRIILAYLDLADRLADRFRHSRGTTPEDLRQTARAGLIAAIDRYDPDHGNPFVPYAVACVVGELKRYLRDTSWRLHVPRPLKEQAMRVCKTAELLQQSLGRSPSTAELAQHLEVTEEDVLEALLAAQSRQELSLDRPVDDDTECCLSDLMAAPGPREEPEDLLALPRLIAALPELDRRVIILRFFHDLDQDTIAAEIGYSQMQVSRLLRRALTSLRVQFLDAEPSRIGA
jgi:RNA polymerase sigma-B factor